MRAAIYALFGASSTILAAWALGTILLRKLFPSLHRLEQRLLATITGSACLSAVVFVLCTAGFARKGAYLVFYVLVVILFVWPGAHHRNGLKSFPALPHAWCGLLVVGFSALTVLHLFSAMAPEIYRGETTQRLSLVDRAQGFHGKATLSEGAQFLLLPAFAFGRQSGAELVTLSILASLSLLMFYYGRRVGYPVAGVAAGLLTYAGPALFQRSLAANTGVIVAAALFGLFYLLQLWDEQPELPLPIPIGILAGFCGIANPAAILALPYAIGLTTWKLGRRRVPRFRAVLVVSILALAFSVPWMVQQRVWGRYPVLAGLNELALFAQQHRWELTALLFLCAVPVLLALQLPPGRQLLLAATVFALPPFANAGTPTLALVTPFALLAIGLGLTNPALAATRRLHDIAARALPCQAIRTRFIRLAGAATILAYFAYFAWDGLLARFSIFDDPKNLFYYWSRGAWPLIRAQFEFFSTYYRPMGGLFYLTIYHFAGFTPLPYRAVALLSVLVSIALFYRVAKLLSGSESIAWLSAILVCYHPRLGDIIYDNSVIYDVLCFLFYFAALAWYLGIRARGRLCTWRQTAVFVVLYICALNSKEMAVTLPVTVGLFELLFHPPQGMSLQTIRAWLDREGRLCLIAALLTAVYILGKTLGPDPVTAMPEYRLELTLQKFGNSIAANIRTLFYLPDWFGPGFAAGACGAFLVFAWIKRSGYIAFCVLFAILSELPIAFIGRSGSCLYIPLAAWAMLVSAAVWAAAQRVASMFRHRAVAGQLVAIFIFFNARLVLPEAGFVRRYFVGTQAPAWSAIQQFSRFDIHPPHGARIAFLHDPLELQPTMYLAFLQFRDLTLKILVSPTALSETDLSGIDYVFDYQDGKFIQVKP